ncbi:MAG: hypothetical protein HYW01_07585 [Deltaproteobacteria bacterium]|nr:hypothetical protein [Deltaproteobacteria bacterium]
MSGHNLYLILLSTVTIIAVVVALKTPLFIKDERERTYQVINFLLGIIGGYIFASPLGGILLGVAKESGEIVLTVHRRLFNQDMMLSLARTLMFWVLGGFFGSHALEYFRQSTLLLLGT